MAARARPVKATKKRVAKRNVTTKGRKAPKKAAKKGGGRGRSSASAS